VRAIGFELPRPRWTLRLRLTLLYGSLFLLTGAVLLAITYELVASSDSGGTEIAGTDALVLARSVPSSLPPLPVDIGKGPAPVAKGQDFVFSAQAAHAPVLSIRQLQAFSGQVSARIRQIRAADTAGARKLLTQARAALAKQRSTQLDTLLTRSGIALALMALLSIGLGWLMAGRALRPLRTMSARAKGISERNLHERLALAGPDDELKELGDTFDGLLARLEAAFESQRRFVANASHELRTPITVERALVEVALADPQPSVASLQDACRRVLTASEEQERLIEALLTLARSQRGLERREPVDLGAITREVLLGIEPNGVRVQSELGEARTTGDPALVERLIANLVGNALHHNESHGWLRAWTGVSEGRPALRVSNPGPVISPEQAHELAEPFRRLNGNRAAHKSGLGLGLSIVAAIATAHDADLRLVPRPAGGLDVTILFPRAQQPRPS
jgi:signal transduction histidine kinase